MSKLRELIDSAEGTPLYSIERFNLQVWAWQNIKEIADMIDAAEGHDCKFGTCKICAALSKLEGAK